MNTYTFAYMAKHLGRKWLHFSCILNLRDIEVSRNFRYLSTSKLLHDHADDVRKEKLFQLVTLDTYFNRKQKDKQSFIRLLETFKSKNNKTGIAEFILVALRRMKEYGVHEDIQVYKQLIDLYPKGPMVANNWVLLVGMFYPKQQHSIVELLCYMEENRVMPDREMGEIIRQTFGIHSEPSKKYMRMMYWMPKFKNISPYPAPNPRPATPLEAAKLAIKQINSVDLESELIQFSTRDDQFSCEDTWIVSGQAPIQRKLIHYHPPDVPMYVEGSFNLYLGKKDVVQYYVLKSDLPKNRRRRRFRNPDVIKNLKIPFFDPPTPDDMIPDFSVHEQRDGIIFAVGTSGTKSKSSLMSWIRLMQKNGNPNLANIPILFRDNAAKGQNEMGQELIGCETKTAETTN